MYNVREAQPEDLEPAFLCVEALYSEMSQYVEPFNTPNLPRLREVLDARIRSKGGVVLVLENDGRVYGVIVGIVMRYDGLYVPDFGGMVGKITDIYLSPEVRGQEYAAMLLGKAEEWFIAGGVRLIQADILAGNVPSGRFFGRMGFSPLYETVYKRI